MAAVEDGEEACGVVFASIGAGVVRVEHRDGGGAGTGGVIRREGGWAAGHRSPSGGLGGVVVGLGGGGEGGGTELARRLAAFFVEEVRVTPGVRFRDRASVCDVAEVLAAAFLYVAAAVQGVVLGGGPGRGCGTPGAMPMPGQAPAESEREQGDGGSEGGFENEGVHLVPLTG
ncbi:hypothetical protein ACFWRG_35080 [Micromonospora tulbaghiae]|uniref:hypothetical protein n=1 Tax=Actinomycetes TaxID=1760 RepID=UPI00142E16F5|nr:hypothetical protein [Streptomyces nanshensis]